MAARNSLSPHLFGAHWYWGTTQPVVSRLTRDLPEDEYIIDTQEPAAFERARTQSGLLIAQTGKMVPEAVLQVRPTTHVINRMTGKKELSSWEPISHSTMREAMRGHEAGEPVSLRFRGPMRRININKGG